MRVLFHPDPILRKKCRSATIEEIDRKTIDEMVAAMYQGDGVGLAAPQVGIDLRFFVMDPTGGEKSDSLEVVINPQIVGTSSDTCVETEGCLSVPGVSEVVERFSEIDVSYIDSQGSNISKRLSGFSAVVFQHEFDHLDGVLFIDRLSSLKRKLLLRDYAKRGSQ